jgi:peptide/nickel transport system ATP-binding protein/oligopeptide transport system ATP-binding protein
MRQRVMIAIALSCEPKVLIADEPTTALDVTIQAQILELIRGLRAKLGMGIVWITHDLALVAGIADRVMVMYAGQVVEHGPVAELFANPQHPYTRALLGTVPNVAGAAGAAAADHRGAAADPGGAAAGLPLRAALPARLQPLPGREPAAHPGQPDAGRRLLVEPRHGRAAPCLTGPPPCSASGDSGCISPSTRACCAAGWAR